MQKEGQCNQLWTSSQADLENVAQPDPAEQYRQNRNADREPKERAPYEMPPRPMPSRSYRPGDVGCNFRRLSSYRGAWRDRREVRICRCTADGCRVGSASG